MTRKLKSITTALILLLFVGLSGCNLAKRGSVGSTPVNNQNSSSPARANSNTRRTTITFTPSNDAEKDLNDAVKRLDSAYPYRLTFTQSATDKPPTKWVVEYAAADRFHVREGDGEWIKIGESAFTKSQGAWKKDSSSSTGMFSENVGIEMVKIIERIWALGRWKEVRSIGKEPINGVPSYAYSFKVESTVGGEITSKAWIGAADGLPRRLDRTLANQSKQQVVYEFVDVTVDNPIR
jgi:hypothetical protein